MEKVKASCQHINFRDSFESIVKRLERLVSTDTSLTSANELPLALYLEDEFKQAGVQATVFESELNRGNIYAHIDGNRPEKLVVHTHLDTDMEMKGSPVGLVRKENLYFGRGTLDCKGLIAVWTQVLIDFYRQYGRPELTIAFAAVADEENGGRCGTEWLMNHTACFEDTVLALCEGGGYAVPAKDKMYFSLQTGEIESVGTGPGQAEVPSEQVVSAAVQKGFYNQSTVDYFRDDTNFICGRSIARESFYEGIWNYVSESERTEVLTKYVTIFDETLKGYDAVYDVLPVISPGYSDNRFFRKKGIDTIGFFPLHPDNYIGGIHGRYECISAESITFAYDFCKKLLKRLVCRN